MPKKRSNEKRVNILLVEDEESFIDALSVGLDREGFDATVARDGAEAVEFLHRRGKYAESPRPELIMLDLKLPRKNGCEVLEDILLDTLDT